MRRKTLASITAGAALMLSIIIILAAGVRPAAADNSMWGAQYFPNVPLITQDGKTVHFYDDVIKGKIVAINLIYTHCEYSCPLETARLAQVQRILGDRVGKDIFFYSISIDPERDTPEELKAYAAKYHTGPGWTFLTGKKEDIELISRKLGLYSDPSINKDGHTPSLLIGNEPAGRWMRNAAADNPRFLATMMGNFITSWQNRASEGKTSTEAKPIAFNKGQYLFATQCSACHSIGHGDKIGPDLIGVTHAREKAWLMSFISRPDQMLAKKDPIATALFKSYKQVQMPNLNLTSEDVSAILEFLQSQADTQKKADSESSQGNQ